MNMARIARGDEKSFLFSAEGTYYITERGRFEATAIRQQAGGKKMGPAMAEMGFHARCVEFQHLMALLRGLQMLVSQVSQFL